MTAALPLDGIVVADFSRVLAGPYATMTLGDLGADVIKVERPGSGDDTRAWGPPWRDSNSTYYLGLNRNKRSIALDLGNPDDLEVAHRLARRADVLVENFRPGTLDRYGLGFDDLHRLNPGLVYCSITGFGAATPEAAEMSGYDLLVQAMSGLMHVTGASDGPPMKAGVAIVDHVTALQSTIGILAALRSREINGVGQRVEVSLMVAALAALINLGSAFVGAGSTGKRLGNRHPSVAPYQTFQASDGWFVLACGNDTQFARVAAAVGRGELATDPRFQTNAARVEHIDALDELLSAGFATATTAQWIARLGDLGVPAGAINDIGEAFVDAQRLGIDPIVVADGEPSVRSPIRLSATPPTARRRPPLVGEHDVEIRQWLATERPNI